MGILHSVGVVHNLTPKAPRVPPIRRAVKSSKPPAPYVGKHRSQPHIDPPMPMSVSKPKVPRKTIPPGKRAMKTIKPVAYAGKHRVTGHRSTTY